MSSLAASRVIGSLTLFMALALTAVPLEAHAQRDREAASVDRLIEQLRPGGPTRGIRMPSEPSAPAAAASPSMASPSMTPPAPDSRRSRRQGEPGTASIRVRFATGSAALSPQAEQSLDALGRALASGELATYRFRIEGHTDRAGSAELNQALSEKRAEAVRDYLVGKHAIAASRLDVVGRGEDEPEVATADETPDPRNRRVRVVNLGG